MRIFCLFVEVFSHISRHAEHTATERGIMSSWSPTKHVKYLRFYTREWLYTAKKALMDQLVKQLGDRSVYTMHQMVGCFGKWRHWKYEYWMKTSLPCCSGEICNIFQPQSFILHKTKEKWVDFYFQKAGELGYEEDTVDVVFGTGHYLSWLSNLRL